MLREVRSWLARWWARRSPRAFPRPTEQAALAVRPPALPHVEAELAAETPRPFVWMRAEPWESPLLDRYRDVLARWPAVRAWVSAYRERRDSEGFDIDAWLAFESGGRLVQVRQRWAFDAYNWAHAFTDHEHWFREHVRVGGTLTLLHHPEDREDVVVVGDLGLYRPRTLADVLREGDVEEATAMWTLAVKRSRYEICRELASAAGVSIEEAQRDSTSVLRNLLAGGIEPAALHALSEACGRFVPGRLAVS